MNLKSIKEIIDIIEHGLLEGLSITEYQATSFTLVVKVNSCSEYVFSVDGVKLLNTDQHDVYMLGFIEELISKINDDYEKIKMKERNEKLNLF